MKCPMHIIKTRSSREGQLLGPLLHIDFVTCQEAQCGFWDENGDRCAILEISRLLNAIGNTMGTIAKELSRK